MSAGLARILLIEPQFVLRRTIVAVSRDMGVADVQEATSLDAALPLLMSTRFDGLVLDLDVGVKALDLLARLQSGAFASPADTPVIALGGAADNAAADIRLAPFTLLRLISKPFKIAELLQVLQSIAATGCSASPSVPASQPLARQPA